MKPYLKSAAATLALSGFLTFSGCGGGDTDGETAGDTLSAIDTSTTGTLGQQTATAQLESAEGQNVQGTVTFAEEQGGFLVTGSITGLTGAEHGIHIHQNGSCEDVDTPDDPDTDPNEFGGAGGHWPGMADAGHGAPTDSLGARHAGDMGNITAQGGTATLNIDLNLDMPLDSLIGKALVLHANADDLETDPSGNSGARIACGVIEAGGTTGGALTDTTVAGSPTASR